MSEKQQNNFKENYGKYREMRQNQHTVEMAQQQQRQAQSKSKDKSQDKSMSPSPAGQML